MLHACCRSCAVLRNRFLSVPSTRPSYKHERSFVGLACVCDVNPTREAGFIIVTLRACRFKPVSGLAAFDLDTFLAMTHRSRKWQCPTSGFNGTVHDVQVDAFIQRILQQLKVRWPYPDPDPGHHRTLTLTRALTLTLTLASPLC